MGLRSSVQELMSLRSTVHGLAANIYAQTDPRTSELTRELMSQLRVELIRLLAKPSATHVRRFSKKQPDVHLDILSYGEIIRSFETTSFRVSFNLFRKFVFDRDASLHPSGDMRPIYDPALPYSDVVPERNRVYTVQFRSFAGMSAWIGIHDPQIQAKALVRSKHGFLRVLGSLVADASIAPTVLPVPKKTQIPKKNPFNSSQIVNGQPIPLKARPTLPIHTTFSQTGTAPSGSQVVNGNSIPLGSHSATTIVHPALKATPKLPARTSSLFSPNVSPPSGSQLVDSRNRSLGPLFPRPVPLPSVSPKKHFEIGTIVNMKPIPHKAPSSFLQHPPSPPVGVSSKRSSARKQVTFSPVAAPPSSTGFVPGTPVPLGPRPSILKEVKPLISPKKPPVPKSKARIRPSGPLYVFPGYSVQTVAKIEEEAISNSGKNLPTLYIPNSDYNSANRSFCTPFVRRDIPRQSVTVPLPNTPESRYNSFFISWELDPPPSNEFKNDLSVLTACYGTLTLNIPTLSFKAPLTSDRVKKLLADRVLRSILS